MIGVVSQYLSWHLYGEYVVFWVIFLLASIRMALIMFTCGVVQKWSRSHPEGSCAGTSQMLIVEWIVWVFLMIVTACVVSFSHSGVSDILYIMSKLSLMAAASGTYFVGRAASSDASTIVVSSEYAAWGTREFGITRGGPRTQIEIQWRSRGWQWRTEKVLVLVWLIGIPVVGTTVVLVALANWVR